MRYIKTNLKGFAILALNQKSQLEDVNALKEDNYTYDPKTDIYYIAKVA